MINKIKNYIKLKKELLPLTYQLGLEFRKYNFNDNYSKVIHSNHYKDKAYQLKNFHKQITRF